MYGSSEDLLIKGKKRKGWIPCPQTPLYIPNFVCEFNSLKKVDTFNPKPSELRFRVADPDETDSEQTSKLTIGSGS